MSRKNTDKSSQRITTILAEIERTERERLKDSVCGSMICTCYMVKDK